MTSNAGRKAVVRHAIERAFAALEHPGVDAVALPYDDELRDDLREVYGDCPWQELPASVIERYNARLVFLTPAGRHFYLPAYLLHDLDTIETEGTLHWRYWSLAPPDDLTRYAREFDGYPLAQREAIRLFLEYAADSCKDQESRDVARAALERYWGTPRRDDHAPPTRKEQIKQAIREAFADGPLPGDVSIVWDPLGWDERNINDDLRVYPWRQVPPELLAFYYNAANYLNPEGLRRYLPAYLLMVLDHLGDTMPDHVLGTLSGVYDMAGMRERFDGFSPAQRAAGRLFLEYMGDPANGRSTTKEAWKALDGYWAPEQDFPPPGSAVAIEAPVRKEQVRRAIHEAFAHLPGIAEGDILRDPATYERAEIVEPLRGKSFREIPSEVFTTIGCSVYKFTDAARRAYFPAFMLAALDGVGDMVFQVVDHLCRGEGLERLVVEEFSAYSEAERQAIRLFLAYVAECVPGPHLRASAREALVGVWSQPPLA